MESEPVVATPDAAAAAATAAAEPTTEPAPVQPEASELEKSVMAFAAANPTDGKLLMDRIAEIQRQLTNAKQTVTRLETQSLDTELIRNSMEQLLRHLTPEASKRYLVDEKINDQLLSSKPGIAQNAMHRLIAACNSTFMQAVPIGTKPAARSTSPEETPVQAAPKRKRVAEPPVAAAPVPLPSVASDATNDADLLRSALSAQYM
tara:strand:- start:8080 stop:8694 length:615 start_codon:yes stop_codon:yes gene_type:complete